ncbi:MAG: hypothetical protein RL719_657 [Actinomycetota bacterium]|jgi:tRNA dimethylallyltransferase
MSPLIAVVGPTGTGKSNLSLQLAEEFSKVGIAVEIINADSMQFYRGMDIGTAKISAAERGRIPHHLFDWLEITDESTAAQYQPLARAAILEAQQRGSLPVLVGGSMLYLAAVLNTFEFPARDQELRAQLETDLEANGIEELYRRLAKLDPAAAAKVDAKNPRRVVRALEVVMTTGEPFAAALPDTFESWQPSLQIGLNGDRTDLVARLTRRSQKMFAEGLVSEVESLIPKGIRTGKTASRAIGYAQALKVIDGEFTEQQAIDETSTLTARYARRQMSWFRRDNRINWLDYQQPNLFEAAKALAMQHFEASE